MKQKGIWKKMALALAGTLLLGLWGCGGNDPSSPVSGSVPVSSSDSGDSEQSESEPDTVYINGWFVYNMNTSTYKEMEERAVNALERADVLQDGVERKPVCLLATQMVSGTNYCIFCQTKEDGDVSYELAYIYEDLSGGADVISNQPILYEYMMENLKLNGGDPMLEHNEAVHKDFLEAALNYEGEERLTGIGFVGTMKNGEGKADSHMVFCRVDFPREVSNGYFAIVEIARDEEGRMQVESFSKVPIGV